MAGILVVRPVEQTVVALDEAHAFCAAHVNPANVCSAAMPPYPSRNQFDTAAAQNRVFVAREATTLVGVLVTIGQNEVYAIIALPGRDEDVLGAIAQFCKGQARILRISTSRASVAAHARALGWLDDGAHFVRYVGT